MRTRNTGVLAVFSLIVLTAGCQTLPTEFNATKEKERQISREQDRVHSLQQNLSVGQRDEGNATAGQHLQLKKPDNNADQTKKVNSKKRIKVAGIHISGPIAGNSRKMNRIIRLMEQTDLNAVVIDIKNDFGQVTYDSHVPLVNEIGADQKRHIKDISGLVKKLKDRKIYVIGRLVTFNDPYLAASRKNMAMKRKDNGRRWQDRSGVVWVDPFKKEVRQYNLDIAKEAVKLGVDEIQFDYVRFPDNGNKVDMQVDFDNPSGLTKSDQIRIFLRDARKQLKPLGAFISADVFGLTTTSKDDMGIGQTWTKITAEVDYICPMIYPSHYSSGMYGIRHPDLKPYALVKKAIRDALKKNKSATAANKGKEPMTATIRPWYQAFTATWVKPHKRYGKKEMRDQIRAAKEQGVDEYLLWNPHCRYDFMK